MVYNFYTVLSFEIFEKKQTQENSRALLSVQSKSTPSFCYIILTLFFITSTIVQKIKNILRIGVYHDTN